MKACFTAKWVLLILVVMIGFVYGAETDPIVRAFEQGITVVRFDGGEPVKTDNRADMADRLAFYKIPGVSLTVIDHNRPAWNRSYGVRRFGGKDPVTEKTIFQAGSVSKFVTAVVLLHYVDLGLFDLDADVNKYLKSWKIPETEFTVGEKITLRHLLTHRSGLPGTNFDRDKAKVMPTLVQVLKAEAPAINKPAQPFFTPGEKWSYSNIGYAVLQLVLEDHFGKSLDALAREVIFEPLDMKSSTFTYPLPETWQSREAMPHATDGSAREPAQDSPARAQGGLMTTAADMAALTLEIMQIYQGKAGGILSRKMVLEMMEPYVPVPKEAMGLDLKMGLGVFLMNIGGQLVFLHSGHSYPGSVFMVLAMPEAGQGVVMALNGNQGDLLKTEILVTLADLYRWPIAAFFKKGD